MLVCLYCVVHCIGHSNFKIWYIFLPTGANVNVTSSGTGDTPLHITSRRHDHDLSRVLIEHGANLSAINKENKKPSQLIANERQGSDKMTSLF